MKKMRKIYNSMLAAFILLIVSAITASAAKIGDPYTFLDVQLGWWIFFGVIAFTLILFLAFKAKVLMGAWRVFAVLGVIAVCGLVIANFDIGVPVEPADITPDVVWSVSAVCGTTDVTIDDDSRTITALIWADVDMEVINTTDDTAWVTIVDDPLINFTISPSMAVGLSVTTEQATTRCVVYDPDKSFTEDATSYDLFADASGGVNKDLTWTADGTDEYEDRLCTVTLGGSETVQLQIIWLDDGLSQCEAGETEVFTIGIGGVTYTMTVIISGLT